MRTEVYFIDEATLTKEEMETLAGSCEEYSELEELWFFVKDEYELPAEEKESWIGFTYLLFQGADDTKKRGRLMNKLKKEGKMLLAGAVETYLSTKGA